MKLQTYTNARRFLKDTQAALTAQEAANSLMLGVCLRMARHPERVTTPPCLKTVTDERGLVLAAMMTPPHNLIVSEQQGDLDAGMRLLMADLVREGWQVPGVLGTEVTARHAAEQWAAATGQQYALKCRQALYVLHDVKVPPPARGRLRLATAEDVARVAQWQYEFQVAIFGESDRAGNRQAAEQRIADGDLYLWEDEGRPVAMAMQNRPTPHGICVSLVYTPPALRGRGYATACVGELSRRLLASGWAYCTLFMDLENVAAKRVYQKIGYAPLADYGEYVFRGGNQ